MGTFLKGLFRASLPLLKRGAAAVSKELFHTGINFVDDLENDMPAKEAFKNRMQEAKNNLKRKAVNTLLRGHGYKAKKPKKAIQSTFNTPSVRSLLSVKRKNSHKCKSCVPQNKFTDIFEE